MSVYQPGDEQRSVAIIPHRASERALAVRRVWPVLVRHRLALGVLAGAVGSVALKKVVELAVEDLYGRVKESLAWRLQRHPARRRAAPAEVVPAEIIPAEDPLPRRSEPPRLRAMTAFFVGMVRSGGQQESFAALEVREQWAVPPEAPDRAAEGTRVLVRTAK